jgi:hypothetical protein
MTIDLAPLSNRELLRAYAGILDELRSRGAIRSTNNPVADYAEGLCAAALGLTLTAKSTTGHDGIDAEGRRIEVKARRLTSHNPSRQLSALRGMKDMHFDLLAGVLFDTNFAVMKGCLVPHAVVLAHSSYVTHSNSWRFLLRDGVWSLPGVVDITQQLKRCEQ